MLESRHDGQTLDAAAGNVARGNEIRVKPAGIRESVEVVEVEVKVEVQK